MIRPGAAKLTDGSSPGMMCDWISAFCEAREWEKIGYRPYSTGQCLLVSPDGEIERVSSRAAVLEGSFDTRLLVRSRSGADLYISGNPVKFLQGHNLYGPDDPVRLFFDAGWWARCNSDLGFPSAQTWEAGGFQGPRFTRIDVTRSYRFPSAAAARSWLRDGAATARTRHGGGHYDNGTVTFGKHSTRWSLKCYHKGDELHARGKAHKLPAALPRRSELQEWAQGVVRFEVELRAKEIAKLDMTAFAAREVWDAYYGKVQWNQNARLVEPDMMEQELPRELRKTLIIWRSGEDVRQVTSKATYYRHRRELLAELGVDIASPPKREAATEAPGAVLDPAGWDPEPLEGYAWEATNGQRELL